MKILFLLIPLSLLFFALAVWAFFWAVRSGQFDDLDSPGYRILLDDEREPSRREESSDDPPR
ncbi:cbb3-type cytochrome oxidase assembly protein CcoS [Algiphilus aromaticivorans]|uniref:cbb3-type cytochrome oxidase assembly protein CcoS n=1 Tax=Algiphilus aromaticivorans TaxID=382454 RepID=UPI0005C1629B|nr:cbb3-type cytochrome oxidase assembly protein CcoS [Algiphilus aromaticivorans]